MRVRWDKTLRRILRFFQRPPYWIAVGPFQFVLTVFGVFQGVVLILNGLQGGPQGILTETYPHWMVVSWGVLLVAGSVTALYGRIRDSAWRAESGGLSIIGFGLLYFVITVLFIHPESLVPVLPDLGYSYACYVRIRVLRMAHEAELEARGRRS